MPPPSTPLFASLRANKSKRQKPVQTNKPEQSALLGNANVNTLSVNSGNLVVGANQKFRIRNNTLSIGNHQKNTYNSGSASHHHDTRNSRGYSSHVPSPFDEKVVNPDKDGVSGLIDHTKGKKKAHQLELTYHETRISEDLIALNLNEVKGIDEGDLCELKTYPKSKADKNAKKIYFIAKNFNQELKRKSNTTKVSMASGQLQMLLDLPSRSNVWIKVKDKDRYESDVIEINIKDCHLNRGDMWCLSSHLVNSCVFQGQRLTFFESLRCTIKGIYREGRKLLSGYIGEKTRIVFRSESARLFFLIQITEEMWNFEEDGQQMFQKMVNSFFPKIFKKWKEIDTHHTITVAFAIAMDQSDSSFKELKPGERLKNPADYFRIVVDQVNIIHWVEIMETLRQEFVNIRSDLLNFKTDKGFSILKGRFAPVIKSNFLEMVNFATTVLANPFRQVDLRHTTTHIMIITPGSGLYDVDYDLLNLTGRKLLSLEMTMDLICLSRAPLHVVPLFRYLDYKDVLHHCIPNWLSIFFWNDSSKDIDEWQPRCKIYDLQMMGLTDNEVVRQAGIEYLKPDPRIPSIFEMMQFFDCNIFKDEHFFSDKQENKNRPSTKHVSETLNNEQKRSEFLWQPPKSSQPVIQGAQKLDVTANLYIHNNQSFLNTLGVKNDGSESATYNEDISLALDSLKGLSKKNSVRDFTRRILTKLTQIKDTSNSSGSSENAVTQEVNNASQANSIKSKNYNKDDTTILLQSGPTKLKSLSLADGDVIIKKSLTLLGNNESQRLKAQAGDEISFNDSADTNNSQTISNPTLRRPFAHEEIKFRVNNHLYIFNETWLEIKNPSVPVTNEMSGQLLPVRWKDVWPKFVAKKYSKWRSFTTPAELPTTICDFPSKQDFEENFFFRNHSVTLNIDQESYNQTCRDLLHNMVYMRLVAGFQICVGDQVEKVEQLNDTENTGSVVAKYIDNRHWSSIKFYMMIDSEIHRICCSQNGAIDVQRYLRKNEINPYDQVSSYNPMIKTRYESEYREAAIDPVHTFRKSLNWNQIDQFLSGYSDSVVDKKWPGFRAKFVVLASDIPPNTFSLVVNGKNETLTPEEMRVEGLRRLIASITNARLKTEEEKHSKMSRKEEIQPEVTFYTGSLFDFINDQRDMLENSVLNLKDSLFVKEDKRLTKDIDLNKLANEITNGHNKLQLVNRKWHWKKHQNCFVGSEMVNWLIRNFSDIQTRDEAIEYGQSLMNKGMFVHVLNKHSFLDGHYFYQIASGYIMNSDWVEHSTDNNSSNKVGEVISNNDINERTGDGIFRKKNTNSSNLMEDDRSASPVSSSSSSKPTVVLSNSLVIDVDPLKKSYKQESCTVHYDRVHNPDHCFHIRLEWLTTTPKLIDDILANWSRICNRYGLTLIELPWDELCTIPKTNPFHSFVEIPLAINPWEDPEFYDSQLFSKSKFYYHVNLLKSCGFILDNRASKFLQENKIDFDIRYSWGKPQFKYAQYIHKSGSYIAEIRENGDLFLAPNNIHISRVSQANVKGKLHYSSSRLLDSQKIMSQFRDICSSYELLRNILLEIKENWVLHRNVDDI